MTIEKIIEKIKDKFYLLKNNSLNKATYNYVEKIEKELLPSLESAQQTQNELIKALSSCIKCNEGCCPDNCESIICFKKIKDGK